MGMLLRWEYGQLTGVASGDEVWKAGEGLREEGLIWWRSPSRQRRPPLLVLHEWGPRTNNKLHIDSNDKSTLTDHLGILMEGECMEVGSIAW